MSASSPVTAAPLDELLRAVRERLADEKAVYYRNHNYCSAIDRFLVILEEERVKRESAPAEEQRHHCVYRQKLKQFAAFYDGIPAPVRRGMSVIADLEPHAIVGMFKVADEQTQEKFRRWLEGPEDATCQPTEQPAESAPTSGVPDELMQRAADIDFDALIAQVRPHDIAAAEARGRVRGLEEALASATRWNHEPMREEIRALIDKAGCS